MAEAGIEEADLFDDLYAEDEVPTPAPPAPAEIKKEPVVVNGASEVMQENTDSAREDGGQGDQGEYNGDEADEEVDFNLGNGNEYSSNAHRENQGPGIKEDG